MASGVTQIADVVVPEVFDPYVQQLTEEKTRLITSGVIVRDPDLDAKLAGGGIVFNSPSFTDLDNDVDNVSTDQASGVNDSTPNKIGSATEKQVRLSRNNSWSSASLAASLAGEDPMGAIAGRLSGYWARRNQAVFVSTMNGIFADNAAAPSGTDTHTQNDLTNDISGGFVDGVTNFSPEAFLDALVTMGDSQEDLGAIMVHSIVYNRMQKNNLIDFVQDSVSMVDIPTFLGRRVIVDDGVPFSGGTFETWIFGSGAVRQGVGVPLDGIATEVDRKAAAGNGGGQTILHNRLEWALHPVGHAYIGSAPNGGPDNTASANMLAAAGSWSRVWSERKQIKIARLITTEF